MQVLPSTNPKIPSLFRIGWLGCHLVFPVPLCRYDAEADRARPIGRLAGIATPRRSIAIDATASPPQQRQKRARAIIEHVQFSVKRSPSGTVLAAPWIADANEVSVVALCTGSLHFLNDRS
jgi:hypothetical protein